MNEPRRLLVVMDVWPDARWIRSADAPDSVHQVTLVEQAKQAA